jgi:recombinational DNA repair protein (RecF pathway)
MQEYVSDAVVLHTEPNGDMDIRVSLFTRRFGKLTAKAKSARKITSKLAGHLQPGNLVEARIVEKSGLQIVDALKITALPFRFPDLVRLNQLLVEAEADPELWRLFLAPRPDWERFLRVLGWDPREAKCETCGGACAAFHFGQQRFFCAQCALKFPESEVLYIQSLTL